MPIYEFYCSKCNTIFSFLSRKIDTSACPACPKCRKQKLDRQVSRFAATGRAREEPVGDGMDDLPIDEARMERAMTELASDAEHINEEDPKQAAGLMRKFSKLTGLELNESMKEAMKRLEAGEDPEQIEQEMGPMLDGDEDPFVLPGKKTKDASRRRRPPIRDTKLYEM